MDDPLVVGESNHVCDLANKVDASVWFQSGSSLGEKVIEAETIVFRIVLKDDCRTKFVLSEAMCPQDAGMLHGLQKLKLTKCSTFDG